MTPQRVTLTTLGVADLERAKAFYAALGWVEARPQEGIAFYQMHGAVLALFPLAELAKDQNRAGDALGTGAMTLAQNFATEAEVDAAYALALSAGARAVKPPEKVFWGGYSGYYADPDGHIWELAMNPFWPLAEDGSLTLPRPMQIERIEESRLGANDEAAIAALLARCFTTDFGGRSYYQQRHHVRLVVRDAGRIVGHMALCYRDVRLGHRLVPVAGLAEVATDPDRRGAGIASRLLLAAIQEARAMRADFLLLFGEAGLYAANGFQSVGNPLTSVAMTGAQTGEVERGEAEGLMVLALGQRPWDGTLPLDLLGHKF